MDEGDSNGIRFPRGLEPRSNTHRYGARAGHVGKTNAYGVDASAPALSNDNSVPSIDHHLNSSVSPLVAIHPMPKAADSSSTIPSSQPYEVWKFMKDTVKGFVGGGGAGGAGETQQKASSSDKQSFEAALAPQPDFQVRTQDRIAFGLVAEPRERSTWGTAEQRRHGVILPTSHSDDKGRISEVRGGIERDQSLPEQKRRADALGKTSRTGADEHRHRTHESDDRRRRQLDMEKRLEACEKEKQSVSEHLQDTIKKLETAERQNRDLEGQVGRLSQELTTTQDQLHQSEVRRRQTAQSLDETALELKGANLFLTKTDTVSIADIVFMVDALNAEIMQLAAFMADMLNDRGRGPEQVNQSKTKERELNLRAVGRSLIRFLENNRMQHLDPMAVQISVQMCLTNACALVIESWIPGDWRGEGILWDLYASIKTSAIQSVFGRWRAITRSQTRYHECQHSVSLYIARRVEDILSLAGWPYHYPENREFLGKFEERLEQIVTLTLRLHKAIGEDITSEELRTEVVHPNTRFDAEVMDEAFPDDEKTTDGGMEREARNKLVAGTTDLGLWRFVSGRAMVLKKPKVVLLSALEVMLDGH